MDTVRRTANRLTLLLVLLLLAGAFGSAHAQSIYVRLLGTAGPSLSPNQAEAGLLVVAAPEVLLFDCGHGVPNRFAQIGRTGVSKVFLTHVLDARITPRLWYVSVQNSCILSSGTLQTFTITVN